ncbi:helix-turn-helix domain-containing protein [Cochleicola gelatinilyticus]|uniref:AraC family transcriptional regulator n=1 Tax=Cochleicola gelatinilyticus TaxID=1763537 RepID=A0A167IPB0_9FLAO|nr:helix-turn-helix domain-containing protein [Cochleicola gelatinilyticus]OAB79873.1 AraC family transcriptional regulator [Cochleicola gelatinilyticus]
MLLSENHITPINLSDVSQLDTLVEHKRIFNLKDCQLSIFETFHACENVFLSYNGLVVSSMMLGKKSMSIDGSKSFNFVPGESVIIPEGVSMKVDFPEADISHPVQCATLALDWDMVKKNIDYLNETYPNIEAPYLWELNFNRYHFQNNRELAGSVNKLISISMEDNSAKDALADLSLKFLLLRIIQTQNISLAEHDTKQLGERLTAVIEYIHQHLSQKITVDHLSKIACMSKPLFYKNFKQNFGISPIEFVLRQRIHLAKELLKNPLLTITDVCYQCGFNNLNYFSKQFKRIEGTTPTVWR